MSEPVKKRKRELPRGVFRTSYGNRFFVQFRWKGKLRYLGTFATPEEASQACEEARELLSSQLDAT